MRRAIPFLLIASAAAAGELVDYEVLNAREIPAPLVEAAGDGEAVMARAGCLDCHNRKLDTAPDLETVGERLSAGEIRLMVVEPRVRFPETAMPAYYAPGVHGVDPDEMVGRTRLSAAEIEAVVAYLSRRSATEK